MRRAFNRSEWAIRVFGLDRHADSVHAPGLVLIQVDGLGRRQMERAMARGRLPFLRKLLHRRGYRAHTLYSGLPSSTPAVQAELFFGVPSAIPAFGFRDRRTGKPASMIDPGLVSRVEECLSARGEALLRKGSAYADVYTGGADEAHFCPGQLGWAGTMRDAHAFKLLFFVSVNFYSFLRIAVLMVAELLLALADFARGSFPPREIFKELKFVPTRVGACVLLRELVTLGAKIDVTRGMPIVHVNFLGYDEQSHRRGPDARFAHWALKGIDDAIARIWRAAEGADARDYSVWIYSDHGQERAQPWAAAYGRPVAQAVAEAWRGIVTSGGEDDGGDGNGGAAAPAGSRVGNPLRQCLSYLEETTLQGLPHAPGVVAMGPVGFIYFPRPCTPEERDLLAARLAREGVPLLLAEEGPDEVLAFTADGTFRLPRDAARIFGPDHPFLEEAPHDLVRLCRHPDAGDLVICGWRDGTSHYTFAEENGAHGGFGTDETKAFCLLPADVDLPETGRGHLRPADLRRAAMARMNIPSGRRRRAAPRPGRSLRVMTYNVHGCRGMDGVVSPERIARVIARLHPDIVALQELDVARPRSGGRDQAHAIAECLEMKFHFHPVLQVEEEKYGDAILTHLPMRLVRRDTLPGHPFLKNLEPRGAIWVAVPMDGMEVQVINTHFGLYAAEQRRQAETLVKDWLCEARQMGPVILCGDFNAGGRSQAYRQLCSALRDVQQARRPRSTFFGRYPILRIDHILVSEGIEVIGCAVSDSRLARIASDHLPLVADVRLPAAAGAQAPPGERTAAGSGR